HQVRRPPVQVFRLDEVITLNRFHRRAYRKLARQPALANFCYDLSSRPAKAIAALNTAGLKVIESSAPATIRFNSSAGTRPSFTPRPERINENSPICASAADTISAVRVDPPSARTIPKAASDFPITTIASTAKT